VTTKRSKNKATGRWGKKPARLTDLPAKCARADRERSIKGGTVWGSTRVLSVRLTES